MTFNRLLTTFAALRSIHDSKFTVNLPLTSLLPSMNSCLRFNILFQYYFISFEELLICFYSFLCTIISIHFMRSLNLSLSFDWIIPFLLRRDARSTTLKGSTKNDPDSEIPLLYIKAFPRHSSSTPAEHKSCKLTTARDHFSHFLSHFSRSRGERVTTKIICKLCAQRRRRKICFGRLAD